MMRDRNSYLGEVLFLIATIYKTNMRNRLHKIYYGIQHKQVYSTEILELEKIKREIEREQEMLWDE